METKDMTFEQTFSNVFAYINKSNKDLSVEEKTELAISICSDAPTKHKQSAGFGDSPETYTNVMKAFGETSSSLLPDEKLIEIEVVNDTTIEYPVDSGDMELYTFEPKTLERLGQKLEGIPVVIGKGHDADLPLAYFTTKYEVRTVTDEQGGERTALFGYAKVRDDEDSPIKGENLFKDGRWAMNGGEEPLAGSLKFSSNDIPFYYNDGVKLNYMTQPSPRHYALLDAPYIADSGVKNKNFGTEVENMSDENTLDATVEAVAEVEAETPAPEEVETTEATKEEVPVEAEVEAEAEAEVEVETEVTVETVPASEHEELMQRLVAVEKELADARRENLVEQIAVRKFGAEYTEEQKEEILATTKAFGEGELTGYLAGLAEGTGGNVKSFGKGRTDTSESVTSPGLRLNVPYLNKKKQ